MHHQLYQLRSVFRLCQLSALVAVNHISRQKQPTPTSAAGLESSPEFPNPQHPLAEKIPTGEAAYLANFEADNTELWQI